jgi:hypothetical protein
MPVVARRCRHVAAARHPWRKWRRLWRVQVARLARGAPVAWHVTRLACTLRRPCGVPATRQWGESLWFWGRRVHRVAVPEKQRLAAEIAYRSSAFPRSDGADWPSLEGGSPEDGPLYPPVVGIPQKTPCNRGRWPRMLWRRKIPYVSSRLKIARRCRSWSSREWEKTRISST